MKALFVLLTLTLSPAAHAQEPSLLSQEDVARIVTARGNERLFCAGLVLQSITQERARCAEERAGRADAGECASLRRAEHDAMQMVRMQNGGIDDNNLAFTLEVMARSGCPGVFTLQRPDAPLTLVERTRWSRAEIQSEFFLALQPDQRELRVGPPAARPNPSDDLLDDLQRRAEDLLGFNVTPRLRCGISEREVLDFHYRNGQIILGTDDVAFAGCVWSSQGHNR